MICHIHFWWWIPHFCRLTQAKPPTAPTHRAAEGMSPSMGSSWGNSAQTRRSISCLRGTTVDPGKWTVVTPDRNMIGKWSQNQACTDGSHSKSRKIGSFSLLCDPSASLRKRRSIVERFDTQRKGSCNSPNQHLEYHQQFPDIDNHRYINQNIEQGMYKMTLPILELHVSSCWVDAALFGEGPFYPCLEFPPRVVLVHGKWLHRWVPSTWSINLDAGCTKNLGIDKPPNYSSYPSAILTHQWEITYYQVGISIGKTWRILFTPLRVG